jgi:hypothetical protein
VPGLILFQPLSDFLAFAMSDPLLEPGYFAHYFESLWILSKASAFSGTAKAEQRRVLACCS